MTVLPSLVGGVLIGLAAAALLIGTGRIAGVSGALGGLIRYDRSAPLGPETLWRLAFVLGLLAGGVLLRLVHPDAFGGALPRSIPALVVAGILVGFGTRLGNGCTSGHGVCGIGRLSLRSVAATAVFMITGAAATYVVQHVLGGAV